MLLLFIVIVWIAEKAHNPQSTIDAKPIVDTHSRIAETKATMRCLHFADLITIEWIDDVVGLSLADSQEQWMGFCFSLLFFLLLYIGIIIMHTIDTHGARQANSSFVRARDESRISAANIGQFSIGGECRGWFLLPATWISWCLPDYLCHACYRRFSIRPAARMQPTIAELNKPWSQRNSIAFDWWTWSNKPLSPNSWLILSCFFVW